MVASTSSIGRRHSHVHAVLGLETRRTPWNLALGFALESTPLVLVGLEILRLPSPRLDARFPPWVNSPCVRAVAEGGRQLPTIAPVAHLLLVGQMVVLLVAVRFGRCWWGYLYLAVVHGGDQL